MLDAPSTPTDTSALNVSVPEAVLSQVPLVPAEPAVAIPAAPRPPRIPHFGHLALLSLLLFGGLVCAVMVIVVGAHFHAFGVSRLEDSMHSMVYAVGTMAVWYLVAFLPAAAIFPSMWGKSLPAGLQWNAGIVRRNWPILMGTGAGCFLLALAAKTLLHFPEHSPIAGLLSTRQAVWIMFAFAVTVAPLCEEIMFRGFLLPALSTAFDWTREKLEKRPAPALLENGHPQWSVPAMIFASLITSATFALFHMSQNGNALGPLVLIFSVSLVLCAVRLATRSLAASTFTHATYNFTLFLVMAVTTQGFQHLHN